MTHEYNSSEYYAQTFRDYCQKNPVPGYGFLVSDLRHSGGFVCFGIQSISCRVGFDMRSSRPYSILEVELNEGSYSAEKKLRVLRTKKKGKATDETWSLLFENFIVPHFKKAISSNHK